MAHKEGMVKFLIATHGHLADGFKSSLSIIMGAEIANQIDTLNLFVKDDQESNDVNNQISNYFNTVELDQQVIVFTDVMYGSVNQFMIPFAKDDSVFIITGVNLPLLCEVLAMYGFVDQKVDYNTLQEVVMNATKELLYVNDFVKEKASEHTENDFFD